MAGKRLSEITVEELPPLIPNAQVSNEEEEFGSSSDKENIEFSSVTKPELSDASANARRKWSPEQSELVLRAFHKHVIGNSLPGKVECLTLLSKNPCLRGREWKNLKDFVRNHKVTIARQKRKQR